MAATDRAVTQTVARKNFHRPAWSGSDITKAGVSRELTAAQWHAADELLRSAKARGLKLTDIKRADFDHPALNGALAGILHEIRTGRGIVILRGFPVDRYDLDDIERVYFGLGTHFGAANTQNTRGDVVGRVTDRKTGEYGRRNEDGRLVLRGYENNSELDLHNDPADIAALLCVRKAKSGGITMIADAFKV